jgi:hypothetical protein
MCKLVDSSWYMVNGRWVKNVNNVGLYSSLTCACLSPTTQTMTSTQNQNWVEPAVVRLINPTSSTHIYTGRSLVLYLLNILYTHYPHSLLIDPKKKFNER